MTNPLDYSALQPEERRYSPVGAWIAWIVIVLAVAFIVISVSFPELRGKTRNTSSMDATNFDLTLRITAGEYQAFKDMGAMSPLQFKELVQDRIRQQLAGL